MPFLCAEAAEGGSKQAAARCALRVSASRRSAHLQAVGGLGPDRGPHNGIGTQDAPSAHSIKIVAGGPSACHQSSWISGELCASTSSFLSFHGVCPGHNLLVILECMPTLAECRDRMQRGGVIDCA